MARSKSFSSTKDLLASWIRSLHKSIWLFPFIMGLLLLGLTALRINGSSIGIYHSMFYGNTKDSNLLLNKPQSVRSDEWLVTTQLTIAQQAVGFPRINQNIDVGRDMSLVGDAPYKDWSSIFRPQNLAFFILPLEFAFAFKWWFELFLIIISGYFLVLRFFPGKRLFASQVGTAFGLSPFLFWWYSTGTLAPIFYGLFIIIISMRIINNEKILFIRKQHALLSRIIYVVALSYLLVCFALILYPPFQIPIMIAILAFTAGLFLEKHKPGKQLFSNTSTAKLKIFFTAILLSLVTIGLFLHTRAGAVSAINNSKYPSHRTIWSGGTPFYQLFATQLQPQLQRESRGNHYYGNQSEASNFVLLLPFLLIPGFLLLIYDYRHKGKLNWPLVTTQICALLFLAHMFLGGVNPIYKIFFLDKVPHARLWIGLGFVGFLQLLLVIKSIESVDISNRKLTLNAGIYSLLCLLVLLWSGFYVRSTYPKFISSILLIVLLSLIFSMIIFCLLTRRLLWGASILLIFSFASVYQIQPIYHGLGPFKDNKLFQKIQSISKPTDSWATADRLQIENFALVNGRDSITGIKLYPELPIWRQAEGSNSDYIYNRYAHVIFVSAPDFKETFRLVHPDFFEVGISCNKFITSNVDFILDTYPINRPCLKLKDKIIFPGDTFFIYRVVKTTNQH
jgi:hypothetical protein